MSELTKEYLDQSLKHLASKDDLKSLASKNDIDDLAAMVKRGFDDMQGRLDVTNRVSNLETDMKKIKGALRIN